MKNSVNRNAINILSYLLAGDTLSEKQWTTGSTVRYWRVAGRPGTGSPWSTDENTALAALKASGLVTTVPEKDEKTGPTVAIVLTDAGRYAARLFLEPLLK